MRILPTRSRTPCRQQQQHTRTTNNNKENVEKSRGTKAWLVMFCNCLDSLLGGGDSSTSSNVCTVLCNVYILILASLHGIICFSVLRSVRFGSVRFVQCIFYRLLRFLLLPSRAFPLHVYGARILYQAMLPSFLCCVPFRFFIFQEFSRQLIMSGVCECCVHSVQSVHW